MLCTVLSVFKHCKNVEPLTQKPMQLYRSSEMSSHIMQISNTVRDGTHKKTAELQTH